MTTPLPVRPVPVAWPSVPRDIPRAMSAVVFDAFGPADVLRIDTVPVPEVAAGEVLVRVAAVCVGRFLDVSLRAGRHPVKPALPHVLGVGSSAAGTVVAVGTGVSEIDVGQHVAVWPVLGCGNCEACIEGSKEACPTLRIDGVHSTRRLRRVHRGRRGRGLVAARGPGPGHRRGRRPRRAGGDEPAAPGGPARGRWVLVAGAASALGATTAELARHLGARVIGTSRAAWKRERLLAMGLEAALDPTAEGFVDEVRALTGGAGVAVAVDDLGDPDIFARLTDVLAPQGVLVSSGAFLGGTVPLNLARLYTLNERILGVRTGNDARALALWAEVARGFRPVVDRAFPLAEAAEAHRFLEADDNMGRIVLITGQA